MAKKFYSRKKPAHPPVWLNLNCPIIVFVTVCTKNRKPILARPEVHDLLKQTWETACGWLVGKYIIMPDHVHLFCSPAYPEAPDIGKWVQYWKTLVSRRWPWPEEQPIWQRDFWDRKLRKEEKYLEKWMYVFLNPVRKGLVEKPEEWPFSGELNYLRW